MAGPGRKLKFISGATSVAPGASEAAVSPFKGHEVSFGLATQSAANALDDLRTELSIWPRSLVQLEFAPIAAQNPFASACGDHLYLDLEVAYQLRLHRAAGRIWSYEVLCVDTVHPLEVPVDVS
ncbi:MAG: hypothetical protein ACI9DC_004856 [Gammaproteobacteria bacterium]|jgi:hypothetical protein